MSYLPKSFIDNRTPISVKDFGAVGDGATDDTAAIQRALDSLPAGGTLTLPTGTFNIAGTLSIFENRSLSGSNRGATTLHLVGSSAQIKLTTTVTGVAITAQEITDIRVIGPSLANPAVLLDAGTTGIQPILLGASLRRMTFDNCAGGVVGVTPNATIIDITFEDIQIKNCVTNTCLIDLFSANLTTIFFDRVYFSNNQNTANGLCVRAYTDSVSFVNCIVESSGVLIQLLYQTQMTWVGGHIENMYGVVKGLHNQAGAWLGTAHVDSAFLSRGPSPDKVTLVQGESFSAISFKNCLFDAFTKTDRVFDTTSSTDNIIDLTRNTCSNFCDPEFVRLMGTRTFDDGYTYTNLAIDSSFINDNVAANFGSTGITHGVDSIYKLRGDASSQSITFAAGATGTAEFNNTALGIFFWY